MTSFNATALPPVPALADRYAQLRTAPRVQERNLFLPFRYP